MPSDKKLDLEGFDVDTSNVCTADGGFVGKVIDGSQNIYDGDGAISLDDSIVELSGSSATCQMTLASPLLSGVKIIIICYDATNTVDVDATYYTGDVTATFITGASLELVSIKSAIDSLIYWAVIGNEGVTFS